MAVPLLQAEASGVNPARIGLAHVSIAPYGAYACADGSEVLIAVQNGREWESLCAKVLGRPDLAADPRFADNLARVANRGALDAELRPALATFARPDLVAALDAAGIAFGAVNSVLDLAAHPHLRRITVETPGGAVYVPAPAAVREGRKETPDIVPAIGAHTDLIRAEFDQAAALRPRTVSK